MALLAAGPDGVSTPPETQHGRTDRGVVGESTLSAGPKMLNAWKEIISMTHVAAQFGPFAQDPTLPEFLRKTEKAWEKMPVSTQYRLVIQLTAKLGWDNRLTHVIDEFIERASNA